MEEESKKVIREIYAQINDIIRDNISLEIEEITNILKSHGLLEALRARGVTITDEDVEEHIMKLIDTGYI